MMETFYSVKDKTGVVVTKAPGDIGGCVVVQCLSPSLLVILSSFSLAAVSSAALT